MSETADTLDRHEIAGSRAARAQRIERRDSSTEERCGVGGRKLVGDLGQRLHRRHHVLRIAAVVADTRNAHVAAKHEIPGAAGVAVAAVAAKPADAHALPHLPLTHARPERIDHARDFVPRDPRQLETRPQRFLHDDVAVADAARFDPDPHLV